MRPSSRVRALVLTAALVTAGRAAHAANVDVFPGAGTLQAAIDAAEPGTRLLVHPGVYTGAVTVTKPLKIECTHDAPNDGGCTIDAECASPVAVDIASDGVSIKLSTKKILGSGGGPFLVRRGTDVGIRIAGRKKVKINQLQTTGFVLCGTEQAGVDLSGALTSVKLTYVASFFGATAKIRVSGVPAGSKVTIDRSQLVAYPNEPALLIENSGAGAGTGKGGIVFRRGSIGIVGANATGVRLVDADGVRFEKTYIVPNPDPETPIVGIDVDATSDRNLFVKNVWNDTEADETAYLDAGTGNCGKNNQAFTVPTCQ